MNRRNWELVVFPLNLYLFAFGGGLLFSLAALPLWRAWSHRIGLVDDPGHRKIHSRPTPLAGGLAVLTGLLGPLALASFVVWTGWFVGEGLYPMRHGLSRRALQVGAILLGALGMLMLGLWDDKHDLPPRFKFAGQVLIAALVAASGVRITLFVPNPAFSFAVTILWIVTVTNALNLTDNMNGLCAGLGAVGAFLFGVKAAAQGHYLVAAMALLTTGALVGFLPYNFPRATAFLGDAGSHLVGFLLAVLAILPHFYTGEGGSAFAVLTPLLILAVPLGDMLSVIVIRWRLGKPFYVGDNNHLSHRLVRRGLSPTTAVLLIWLLAAGLGSVAFL